MTERIILFFTLLMVYLSVVCYASEIADSTNEMLKQHPYKLGIFRVGPRFSVFSGYDSNALSTSIQATTVGDYYTSVTPGASLALKLGHRGFFYFDEDLNFLYYKDLN